MSAGLSWLNKNVEWFGQMSWPEAVLVALLSALAILLIGALALALGATGYRKLNPYIPTGSSQSNDDIHAKISQYDDGALLARVAELERIKVAILNDYQRMSGLEMRFQERHERLEEGMRPLSDLPEKLESVRVDSAIAARDLEKLTIAVKDHRDRALGAFSALRARETLPNLERQMEPIYSDLTARLMNGQKYDTSAWIGWESCYSAWREKLDEWLAMGTWYAIAVKERVNTIDDAKYDAALAISDDMFPTADAVRKFKKFAITYGQWMEVRGEVYNGTYAVAFSGLSESEARSGRSPG